MGASFCDAEAPADSVFFAHQLLRSWLLSRGRWSAFGVGFLCRQLAQRRRRTGSAEHESDVRMEGRGRFAVKIVVKIGGAALEDKARLRKCARAIVELAQDGHQVAAVHGGGSALTRTLKLLGKESDFVNGLRITDAETRDVALMVLSGIVNRTLVAAIVAAGSAAVGLCGADGMAFRARKKQNAGGCDLGFVGEICYAEPRWIEAIWSAGGIPVLSSVALGSDGEYYNINADQMASACAVACHA